MRDIETPPARHDDIMAQFRGLSDGCAENLWNALRLFRDGEDPDQDELCGWLNSTCHVYAARVPGCRRRCLVSVDYAKPGAPMIWHGMSQTTQPCAEARHLAVQDRALISANWEPADEK